MSETDTISAGSLSGLPRRIADTKLQSVLIALLFTTICASFGVLVGVMVLLFILGFMLREGLQPTVWRASRQGAGSVSRLRAAAEAGRCAVTRVSGS